MPWGFSGNSDDNETACNTGDLGSIPVLGKSPGDRNGLPTPGTCSKLYPVSR